MKINAFIGLLLLLSGVLPAQDKNIPSVTIGTQVWMAQNLNVDRFRNGDPIPQARTNEEWDQADANLQPAWCYYDNDSLKGARYGKLYNWFAVSDPRGLAPKGWHVATDGEWTNLVKRFGGEMVAGEKMKSSSGWTNGNGTNASRFDGRPGGYRLYTGPFIGQALSGYWWTATATTVGGAWLYFLDHNDGTVARYYFHIGCGFSVRCVRD
jgi:uncharacterized protein (TIGR02145 family)